MIDVKAYGKPGDITLVTKIPDGINEYQIYGLLLHYNYQAMNLIPELPFGVAT
jgi:hypothetical protein